MFFIESKNNIYSNSPERKREMKKKTVCWTHCLQVYMRLYVPVCNPILCATFFSFSFSFSFMVSTAEIGATDQTDYRPSIKFVDNNIAALCLCWCFQFKLCDTRFQNRDMNGVQCALFLQKGWFKIQSCYVTLSLHE